MATGGSTLPGMHSRADREVLRVTRDYAGFDRLDGWLAG